MTDGYFRKLQIQDNTVEARLTWSLKPAGLVHRIVDRMIRRSERPPLDG
jgi:hypothetical protein